MRLLHLALILSCAAACTARPPSPAETASPLARAALVEWQAWGGITVTGWPAARPADIAATAERYARLIAYWNAVPEGGWVVDRLQTVRAGIAATASGRDDGAAAGSATEDIGLYSHPAWSAAFISAVARFAGIPEGDLPSTSRHASYIDAMLEHALADPGGAPFRPYAPEERAPAPGDLLCADRSATLLAHWSARLAEIGEPRPMHCDVVVRSGPGIIEAVGGNVEDLVALRRLPADAGGRILPAPPGEAAFILILAAQPRPAS